MEVLATYSRYQLPNFRDILKTTPRPHPLLTNHSHLGCLAFINSGGLLVAMPAGVQDETLKEESS